MRELSPQVLSRLNNNYAQEYSILIEVEWNDSKILYSDKKINGADYPYPLLIDASGLTCTTTVDEVTEAQNLTITLDDHDGTLKSIIDSVDINHKKVWIYLLFDGHPLDYKILLHQGEIHSPIIWTEGTRTLSFTVLTQFDDIEVGFSMEEGDFPSIPEEALGKVWPLVFGTVCNMQAVQLTSPRRGTLLYGEGISDFTLPHRICQAQKIMCPEVVTGTSSIDTPYPNPINSWDIPFGEEDQWQESSTQPGKYEPADWQQTSEVVSTGIDTDCVDNRMYEICNLLYQEEQQKSYEHTTLTIVNGENFPQDEITTLNINGAKFKGTFSGNVFTIIDRQHPEYEEWVHQSCVDVPLYQLTTTVTRSMLPYQGGWSRLTYNYDAADAYPEVQIEAILAAGYHLPLLQGVAYKWTGPEIVLADCLDEGGTTRRLVEGVTESKKLYDEMKAAEFHWIPAGTEVYLENESEIMYIVSLLPGTVNSVAAYKKFKSGRSLLLEVPTDYYTIYETDYTGYDVVEIGLSKKLSQIDSDWDDEIYVSFTSSVGPNPVDIIEWILTKYTTIVADTTSFASVKTALTNYPSNFYLKERKNVFDLIKDIAHQSRCAVYIRDNTMYIRYLSAEPTAVKTLTETDIIAESFLITHTESEDLNTKHIINWKRQEAGVDRDIPTDAKIVLKHNIQKYGTHEVSYDYYTQNTYDTILKSATFWLIRESNSWKSVEFSTPMKHLDLDLLDCVQLNLAVFTGKCVITSMTFDESNNKIDFTGWTPLLAGTTTPYIWAWPAAQNQLAKFPTESDEPYAGAGYDFIITPPEGHVLRSGYVLDNSIIYSSGDNYPSDIGDTAPVITCDISDIIDFEPEDPEIEEFERLQRRVNENARTQYKQPDPKEGDVTNNTHLPDKENPGEPEEGIGCIYEITVMVVVPTLIHPCSGGGCQKTGKGRAPCTGQLFHRYYTYGSAASACAAYNRLVAEWQLTQESCTAFEVGYPTVYGMPSIKTISDPTGAGEACVSCPGSSSEPNHGEIFNSREVEI